MNPQPSLENNLRKQFPIFSNYPDLIYLDNAATTQKPAVVLDAMTNFYTHSYANIGRGNYPLAAQAEQKYESSRKTVANFIGVKTEEIIFTSGCTDSINQLALMLKNTDFIRPGDEIITTQMEHHANFLPWQQLAKKIGAVIKIWPVDKNGELEKNWLKENLSHKTALLSLTHICNSTGVVNPVTDVVQQIMNDTNAGQNTKFGRTLTFIDGAQAIAHHTVDVKDINCDFYVFSGHKMYAPTGIGVLFGKADILQQLQPSQYGGGAVEFVSENQMRLLDIPHKFEPGTPKLAQAVGLAAAVEFLKSQPNTQQHITDLTKSAIKKLNMINGIQIIANPQKYLSGIVSFVPKNMHPLDVGTLLGIKKIAIRTGSHCTQPLMQKLQQKTGTCRLSFGVYNTHEDVEKFSTELAKILN